MMPSALPGFGGFASGPRAVDSCDADRVLPAGGALAAKLLPEAMVPFERRFAILPPDGIYSATPQRPVQFTLGMFVVPRTMGLVLAEYRFQPYRFDGVLAGQPVPLESRRLSLSIAYDMRIAQTGRPGNIINQIIPGSSSPTLNPSYPPQPTGGTVFPPLPSAPPGLGTQTVETIYSIVELSGGAGALAPGTEPAPSQPQQFLSTLFGASALPQSQSGKQGPSDMPFTYYVNEGDNVVITVGVFSPVAIPLAYVEGWIFGYLMPLKSMKSMLQHVHLCS
jgi:hypothetical protein